MIYSTPAQSILDGDHREYHQDRAFNTYSNEQGIYHGDASEREGEPNEVPEMFA